MEKDILIKPIISEKSEILSNGLQKYSFVVSKGSNKIEIKKAIEKMFPDVKVDRVNTMIMPGKAKVRNTRSGMQKGKVSSFKKAIVTLKDGAEIDFFGDL